MENSRNLPRLNKTIIESVAAYERALEEILARVVISAGSRLAVAYSGGLDSSVLLRLTQSYCAAHNVSLFALHIHHGLSPNADAWMTHCQTQAAALGVQGSAGQTRLTNNGGPSWRQQVRTHTSVHMKAVASTCKHLYSKCILQTSPRCRSQGPCFDAPYIHTDLY